MTRAALITLPLAGEGPMPAIAGKSIAHRQLLFAREAGCETVIAFGGGGSADAIDLRHAAENMGMKYRAISNSLALPGIIADEESLLVLQPGLLPESRDALGLLRAKGDRVLVVSAGAGAVSGFERIDLDRAWAGALLIPGHLLGELGNLPEDVAPHGALLRIAMQARLPEVRLADSILDDTGWTIIDTPETAMARTATWQRANLESSPPTAPSKWLGKAIVTNLGTRLLDAPRTRPAVLALAAMLLLGGLVAGFYERPVLGFILIAVSVPVLETFLALLRLLAAPFGTVRRWPWLRRGVDAALLVLGVMAIDSLAHRALFPPVALVSALLLMDRRSLPKLMEPLRDRMVIAAAVAIIAAIATPEIAIMIAAMAVLLANIAVPRR